MNSKITERCILHIMLCGFHHKKGCILEFVYPPLYAPKENKNALELPHEWSNIPSLALPEGAHNYESDSVFFHVESRTKANKTVFGVSTYRQVDAKSVLNKSNEVTRSSVQKSVCVLCTLPLYGVLKTKLNSITHSFFSGGDFAKTELLVASYAQLDATFRHVTSSELVCDDLFVDIDLLSTYTSYRTNLLTIFKLLLLERRVLITGARSSRIANTLLALLSLFPATVRYGLLDAVPSSADRLSAEAEFEGDYHGNVSVSVSGAKRKSSLPIESIPVVTVPTNGDTERRNISNLQRTMSRSADTLPRIEPLESSANRGQVTQSVEENEILNRNTSMRSSVPPVARVELLLDKPPIAHSVDDLLSASSSNDAPHITLCAPILHGLGQTTKDAHGHMMNATGSGQNSPYQSVSDSLDSVRLAEYLDSVDVGACRERDRGRIVDESGFPLVLYDMRLADSFCLPYACLQDLNWLMRTRSRSFLIGCNNPLFTMPNVIKIYDAIVDEGKVKLQKHEIHKQLKLTSADLRFLVRLETATLSRRSHDENLFDSTNWEGSDDWIREQFRAYLIRLLHVTQTSEQSGMHEFGLHFVKAFRKTTVFRLWDTLASYRRLGDELNQIGQHSTIGEHRKKLSAVNEGFVRGKQMVSNKLALFLGRGKEWKTKKLDRTDHEFSASNNASLVETPTRLMGKGTRSPNIAKEPTVWYEKTSNVLTFGEKKVTSNDFQPLRPGRLEKIALENDQMNSNSSAALRRWASTAASGNQKSSPPTPAPGKSETLNRL